MKIPLNVNELKRSNTLVTGANQQGKSRLAMGISDILIRENWQVLVFDNVGHWKNKSSIPYYIQVSENNLQFIIPKLDSIIYDVSRLLPVQQKEFVETVLAKLWSRKLDGLMPKWTLIVAEEMHLYCRHLRSLAAQNFMRIFSTGANHKIRCLGITPSLTGVDPEFIRLTEQRYIFRESNETSAKRRFKSYYNSDWLKVALELDIGYCIYYLKGSLKIYKMPLFESTVQPQPVKPKQHSFKGDKSQDKPLSTWQLFKALAFAPFNILDGGISTDINSIKHSKTFQLFNEQEDQEETDLIILDE